MLALDKDFNQDGDTTRFKSIGGRSQAVQDERVGKYSQIYSGLRLFDADIGVKNLKKWGLNGGSAGIPEASRFCALAGKRIRQIVQQKKWQCHHHIVIVRSLFESKSERVLKSSVFAPLGDAI
jgi:hypothetical protein